MIIGIDIDDTITNSSEIFVKYAKIYNATKNINYSIITSEIDQKKAFGWDLKNQTEFASQYLKKILKEATPNKNVVKNLKILKELGYKIIFISARKDSEVSGIYEFTKKWLIDNNIEFDKLIVNCNNKLRECLNNNVKLFIDDNYFTCKEIYNSKKIKVLLYETRYNKKYTDKNLIRVKNWNNIIKIIKEKL